jgi:hypothetical protein
MAGGPDGGPVEGQAVTDHDERDDYNDEPWRRRPDPAARIRWPALLLCTFGMIQLGFSIVTCIWLPAALIWNWIDSEFFDNDGPQWPEVLVGTLLPACCICQNTVIVIGTRRLSRFRSYRLALWAVILSFLPLPVFYCGLATIPLSVWALVDMRNRDVGARFDAVAREAAATNAPLDGAK